MEEGEVHAGDLFKGPGTGHSLGMAISEDHVLSFLFSLPSEKYFSLP
jgi:hypothetical protein